MSGPRSNPPDLAGFAYVKWLGGGGFADVFLYEQQRPRRRVAIKVIRNADDAAGGQALDSEEADLMAAVSHHRYIVSVHGVETAPDGRQCLIMEYYPLPHFGQRSRETTLPIAEVLQVGIQIASAVETAHRADIIHRDIKPANILTSAYNEPGLTDFGISAVRRDEPAESALGLSIAYAPPEILNEESSGDVRTDVYSLAATVYALAAGRSPFERPGRYDPDDVMYRVRNEAPPPIGRSDLPQSLELALRQGLSKRPGDRPPTALAFARALQDVEHELQLSPTKILLVGRAEEPAVTDPPRKTVEDADDKTKLGRAQVIDPGAPPAPRTKKAPEPEVIEAPSFVERAAESPSEVRAKPPNNENDNTVHRPSDGRKPAEPPKELVPQAPPAPPSKRIPTVAIAAAAVAILGVGGIVVFGVAAGSQSGGTPKPTSTSFDAGAAVNSAVEPPAPRAVASRHGTKVTVVVSPGPKAMKGDTYLLYRNNDEGRPITVQPGKAVSFTIRPGETGCVKPVASRDGVPSQDNKSACPTIR